MTNDPENIDTGGREERLPRAVEKGFDHCSLAGCLHPLDAMTEKWRQPICQGHRTMLGYPTVEPQWQAVFDQFRRRPLLFAWRNTTAGPVKVV